MTAKPPGAKWILILGVAGFAAGFIGPMVFVPEANQGPLVGIFMSGPAGVFLGLALWGACALIKLPPRLQWRLLYGIATVLALTTLVFVQPDPALEGYVFDSEVTSCASPLATESRVLDYWKERTAQVTWATPRAGWQEDIHRVLGAAPGVVVTVDLQRTNAIRENRKPWNRGSEFAEGWRTKSDEALFYDADGACDRYPEGSALRGFQRYTFDGRPPAPRDWPPSALLEVLVASKMEPVPEKWRGL